MWYGKKKLFKFGLQISSTVTFIKKNLLLYDFFLKRKLMSNIQNLDNRIEINYILS